MREYRLALIGFGTVGQGLAEVLATKGDWFRQQFGVQLHLVAICDLYKGSLYDPEGLDPHALLTAVRQEGHLKNIAAPHSGWSVEQTITQAQANVVVEVSFTDLQTAQPATDYIKLALKQGKHVITTNKGPIALHYPSLAQLAAEHSVQLGVEGTVMSGTPSLRLGREMLVGAEITRIQGILNGTTNYILTQMERGTSYAEALAEAQAQGYAEADPTGDVEGYDAAGKVVILANLLMGGQLTMTDVECQGITSLTAADITAAHAQNECWKLLGIVERQPTGKLKASVKPQRLALTHPLASIAGVTNAITYTTTLLGDVTLVGSGAGRLETGYALIEDLLAIGRP